MWRLASAEKWHIEEVKAGRDTRRHIDGAVVADGVVGLKKPTGSILVIDPSQEQEIENAHTASRMAKITLSENEDLVQERSLIFYGVQRVEPPEYATAGKRESA